MGPVSGLCLGLMRATLEAGPVSEDDVDLPTFRDGSAPIPRRTLMDWAEQYPGLLLSTIAIVLTEAKQSVRVRGIDGASGIAMVNSLVSARLQDLDAQLGFPPEPTMSDMRAAANHLNQQIDAKHRAHLNAVAEMVFISHAGQPADVVLMELMREAVSAFYLPDEDVLQPAADAISVGRRFAFV